ncbi:MAG: hypothetical protein ACTSVI_12880 [Promethearchaeota archaeon]
MEREDPLQQIFSVKYAPKKLSEIIGHEEEIKRLRQLIESNNINNIIIAGPDGAGKLTLAKCFTREVFKDEIGASFSIAHVGNGLSAEERKQASKESYISSKKLGSTAGLKFNWPKFIQIKVKPFVELKAMNSKGFKLLVVTDFHLLGNEQQGFRRLMEQYGGNCRFILITTRISSIIDPIKSRCQILLVKPIPKGRFYREISKIGKIENFSVNYTFINALNYVTKSNLGKALNIIQIMLLRKMKLNVDNLHLLLKEMDPSDLLTFFELSLKGDYFNARNMYYEIIKKNGYNFHEFLEALCKAALITSSSQIFKAKLVDVIGYIDQTAFQMSSIEPHLFHLITSISRIIS